MEEMEQMLAEAGTPKARVKELEAEVKRLLEESVVDRARIQQLERHVEAYADSAFTARKLLDEALTKLHGVSGGPAALREEPRTGYAHCLKCGRPLDGHYEREWSNACPSCGRPK